MKKIIFGVLLVLPFSFCWAAKESGDNTRFFNASVIPNISVYGRDKKIHGFTLSLWGENEQSSFALGLINGFRGKSSGLALGLVNYGEYYEGAQLSFVNYIKKDFTGFQWGFLNYVAGTMKGVQLGIVNYAHRAQTGIQIGLANIISENTPWFSHFPKAVAPAMVLANWSF